MKLWFIVGLVVVLIGIIVYIALPNVSNHATSSLNQQDAHDVINQTDLVSGGPPKDGIPSIDNPIFTNIDKAKWLSDDAEVFILIINDTTRIYPQPIMVWHEIVNDYVEGLPIVITYCPLCGSTIAYKRVINDKAVEFGTTGLLYNSNLVMYDRLTDSYWTQIRGEAVIGKLSGMKLEKLPLQTMKWKDARARFPHAQVLSKKTGFSRAYGTDPYIDYYAREEILFPVKNTQSKYDLGTKTIIIGLTINNESRAYTAFDLLTQRNITDTLGGETIELIKEPDGFVTVTNKQTGKIIPWERDFWFAWLAFHPDTTAYQK